MSEQTAYIMTDILKGVVKEGTAKRLKNFEFDLAGKTGTVGVQGSSSNTDAFNVSYTTEHTIVSLIGTTSDESMKNYINGSTYPTEVSKNILECLYESYSPAPFKAPSGVVYMDIDTRSLDERFVELALDETQNKYKKNALFNENHLPKYSNKNNAHKTKLQIDMFENEKPILKFKSMVDNLYILYRYDIKNKEVFVNENPFKKDVGKVYNYLK